MAWRAINTIEVTLILMSRSQASRSSFVASPIAPPTPTARQVSSGTFFRKLEGLTNIHKDAQTAEGLHSAFNGFSAGIFIRNISLNNLGDAAFPVNHVFRALGPFRIAVYESNFGALSGEQDRGGTPIANFTFGVSVPRKMHIGKKPNLPGIREPAPETIATSPVKSKAFVGGILAYEHLAVV